MRLHRPLVAAALAALSAHSAAQILEIKGVRIGMPESELEAAFGKTPLKDFSVAGIESTRKTTYVNFREGTVDVLSFNFSSDDFDQMLEAVKEKYPRLRCTSSPATNLFGAVLTQTYCTISDKTSNLSLTRFSLDARTSALSLFSHKFDKEVREKNKKQKKDL